MARRRANGEGTVRQRKDGKWEGRVVLRYDANGRPVKKSVYGGTEREVLERILKIRAGGLAGVTEDPGRLTLPKYLDTWLEDVARLSVRANTYASYKGLIRNHVNPFTGPVLLSKVTPLTVQSLYSALEKAERSARVRQLAHVVLHAALKHACNLGLIPINPCDRVKAPKVERKQIQYLTAEQAQAFLETAIGDRHYALYLLAIVSGLRQGELFGLRWSDVEIQEDSQGVVSGGAVTVRRQVQQDGQGNLQFVEVKTGSSRRRVDIPASAAAELRAHHKRMLAEGCGGELVFPDTLGGPIRKQNFNRRSFQPLRTAAGLSEEFTFHGLRHTCATLLLLAGVHVKVVSERLGHSKISITLDIYSHVIPSLQKDAGDKIGSLLEPKPQKDKDPVIVPIVAQ